MKLDASNLVWSAGGRKIVDNVSLDVRPGEFLGIIGPNGSGKTSLMALLSGIRQPHSGELRLSGRPMRTYSRPEIARQIALVEQQAETTERITARQAVELGRTPHLSAFTPWSARDDRIVANALAEVGMSGFASRMWHTLSGGERQRLHIARALAQEPHVLLLDEPTNHLDIHHQIGLLELVRSQELTVVAALHDLNHAAMFCDRIGVMQAGKIVALGSPAKILTPQRIQSAFGVSAHVEQDADGQCFIRYHRPRVHSEQTTFSRKEHAFSH
ncbi:MAG: ABC transporter ATP-binding protein [Phyllobacterium sp.]